MENIELTSEDKELVVETHLFTTMRYKNQADNGFSGNVALLIEAIQHSEKVLDEDLKVLAKGILQSVIKHHVITHKREDLEAAIRKKQDEDKAKAEDTVEVSAE